MTSDDKAKITKEAVRRFPASPGVYLMKDSRGKVLYVGKASNLRSRVLSYFLRSDGRQNVVYLIPQVHKIDTLVTVDDRMALRLEADLIKKYKPHYNIRLKDDKSHLYVRIDIAHRFPRLELVREPRARDEARYIGPFVFSYELRTLIDTIRGAIPLRSCSDRILMNRVRPCLEYQIKRCAAPCCFAIDESQYAKWVEQAIRILNGDTASVSTELEKMMHRASEELRYEDAATLRDRLKILHDVGKDATHGDVSLNACDVFGFSRLQGMGELSVLFVRNSRLRDARSFAIDCADIPPEEILSSALRQFYESEVPPAEVVLPFQLEDQEILQEILSERRGGSVSLSAPLRGSKLQMAKLAEENAREALRGRMAPSQGDDSGSEDLQLSLQLPQIPRIIECVDISHFQGGDTVGVIIVFKDGKPDRSNYRKYILSQEGKPDDFASMRETIRRHLSHAAEDGACADLMVIDGGVQQLNQGIAIRRELGVTAPLMIGLAKKRYQLHRKRSIRSPHTERKKSPERIFVEGARTPIFLRPSSKAILLLERIRDEAHRFAITFHRARRSSRSLRSALDDIPGIGPRRRLLLLRAFGTVKAIGEQSPEELKRVAGIPLPLAERVLRALKMRREGE